MGPIGGNFRCESKCEYIQKETTQVYHLWEVDKEGTLAPFALKKNMKARLKLANGKRYFKRSGLVK